MITKEVSDALEQMLPIVRNGTEQETYWNYSFTPITDPVGTVLGVFNQGNEITRAVVSERRLAFQIQIADRLRSLTQPEEIWAAGLALLGEYLGAARVGFGGMRFVGEEDGYLVFLRFKDLAPSETLSPQRGTRMTIEPNMVTAIFGDGKLVWPLPV